MHFEGRLQSLLRSVQSRGLRGLDALSLASSLAEREALGKRVSTVLAVRNFHRAEARRRAAQEVAARISGWAQPVRPRITRAEERRALIDAMRTVRQGLTDREAAQVAESLLRPSNRPGPRLVGALVRRAGAQMVQALQNRRDGDTGFLVDPRCARILLAGMRMWLREESGVDAGLKFRG